MTIELTRLEPDLTLHELIDAARKRRKVRGGLASNERGLFEPAIAERLKKLRMMLTKAPTPKPPITHMKRSVLLRQVTEFNTRLKNPIEFVIASPLWISARRWTNPTTIGAALGATAGELTSGKTKRQIWVDDEGKETDPPVAHPVVGAAIGAGAGLGATAAHQSIMKNYGGVEAGAGQAYANAARNVGQSVTGAVGTGLDALKKRLAGLKGLPVMGKFLQDGRVPKKVVEFAIHINPANKGKLTATEKRTGKSASELLHSRNPLTRKRANFALTARKWNHA
jgi:hypothetical protein